MRWTVVIPVKAMTSAKSRLRAASADVGVHHHLVAALRADTETAARAADGVARVLLVSDEAVPGAVLQRSPGLNGALSDAAAHAAATWPADGVAALVGDLPALRAVELAEALAAAAAHPRAFVPDHTGVGTSMLTAAPGVALLPRFGPDSAQVHARDAARLEAGPGLRIDVDTPADLGAALRYGVGPATARVVADAVHLDVG